MPLKDQTQPLDKRRLKTLKVFKALKVDLKREVL
jgi:hypothetical protein